jgi:hypothetical protein
MKVLYIEVLACGALLSYPREREKREIFYYLDKYTVPTNVNM